MKKSIVSIESLPSTLNFDEMTVVRGGAGGPQNVVVCDVPGSGIIGGKCDKGTWGKPAEKDSVGTEPVKRKVCDASCLGYVFCVSEAIKQPLKKEECSEKTKSGKKD